MARFLFALVLLALAVPSCSDSDPVPVDSGRSDAGRDSGSRDSGRTDSGSDAGCTAGMTCTPARECWSGFIRCNAGGAECVENMPLEVGTACSTGVCDALGECIAAESSQLVASDADRADAFGGDLDIDGDRLVVGVGDTIAGVYADAAYVYDRQSDMSWNESAILTPSDASSGLFGIAVAVDADRVVVASPEASFDGVSQAGAAYVFELQTDMTWSEVARLQAEDLAVDARFGRDVDVSGDVAVVGQSSSDTDQGSVYVFERQAGGGWVQIQKLVSPEPQPDGFGTTIALVGDMLVVGAPRHDTGAGTASGTVYAFARQVDGTFAPAATVTPSEAQAQDEIGGAVAYDGTYLAIASRLADEDDRMNVGAVYVFERMDTSFSPVQRLVPVEAIDEDRIESVAISGDRLLAGAPRADRTDRTDAGRAYSFRRQADGSWEQVGVLSPSAATMDDRFGAAVATNGTLGVVGSIGVVVGGEDDSGTVYLYDPLSP